MFSSGGVGILVVLVVVAGIALVVYAFVQAAKRREEMAAYATSRGWRYEEEQPLLVDRFDGPPFGHGSSRRATNAVYGQHDGRDFVSFDYQYETTSRLRQEPADDDPHLLDRRPVDGCLAAVRSASTRRTSWNGSSAG